MLYLKKLIFFLILIWLSSHVLQGQYRERCPQPTPASSWEQATWPSPSGLYGALAGSPSFNPSFNLNLSDYVDTSSQQSTQLNTSGTRSSASAAACSATQLQATQTETHSAREGVTDNDPDGLFNMPSGSRKRPADEHGDARY